MQSPGFWFRSSGVLSTLLGPATWIWRLGGALRSWRARPVKAGVPVICIGNLTVGGAGKTPMAMACLERLQAQGIAVHLLSRGHGGRLRGPHRVDPRADTAADVGDEPLLLAQTAPVWIARDRAAGALAAAAGGAEMILLDDGFQNPGLVKDASILMVDAVQGFGNRRLVPAGPLREPVASGLARADLTVLVGPPEAREAAVRRWPELAEALPARLSPPPTGLDLDGTRVLAFAGIARPGKFFATLGDMGAVLCQTQAFADHAPYSRRILERLKRDARAAGAVLVTTEKDAVRLPPAFRREVMVLPIRLEPEDWAPLDRIFASFRDKTPQ